MEERLGIRKFKGDSDSGKQGFSSKLSKSNKGAVGFFKGLFSKKEKQVNIVSETKTPQSKVQLPALKDSVRKEADSNIVGAVDSGQSTVKSRRKRSISHHVTDHVTGDKLDDVGHNAVTAGLTNLRIDAQSFDENINQTGRKPRKHRKKKRDRHKHEHDEGSLSTIYTADSSIVSATLE